MESIMSMSGAPMQTRAALTQVLRALEAAMPAEEVASSLHAQAVKDTTLKSLPAMDLYTEASRDHLAAMAATAGYIRRILHGDTGRVIWLGLQSEMMKLHPSHVAARDALREMLKEDAAQQSGTLQTLGQVMGVVEQAHRAVMNQVQPLATVDLPSPG